MILSEAVSIVVRYDTKGADGRTRRERNEDFGHPSPEWEFPIEWAYLWTAFWAVRGTVRDGFDGPSPISPRDILDWQEVTGDRLNRPEIGVIFDMDRAYLSAWRIEAENNEAMRRDG